MKKKRTTQSGLFRLRVLLAVIVFFGVLLALFSKARPQVPIYERARHLESQDSHALRSLAPWAQSKKLGLPASTDHTTEGTLCRLWP